MLKVSNGLLPKESSKESYLYIVQRLRLKHQNLCMRRSFMSPKATLKCICENALLHIAAQAVNWICVSGKGLRHILVNIFVVYKELHHFLHRM